MRDSCNSLLTDFTSKMVHTSSRRIGWHCVRIFRASSWWSGVRMAFLCEERYKERGSEGFIRSLLGLDRCSLSWASGRGLLEVYWGWTDAASAGDQEEVY